MKYCKTLKELAKHLGITYYQVRKIRDQIEAGYPYTLKCLLLGGKGWPVTLFEVELNSTTNSKGTS